MKKIFLAMAALVCSMSMNAQYINVYKGTDAVATYQSTEADNVAFAETAAEVYSDSKLNTNTHLVQKWFSVSPTKKVQFTNANLYCNTTTSPVTWAFESDQITSPNTTSTASWSDDHVSHFHWAKTAPAAYTKVYSDGENAVTDKFFADGSDANHQLTVDNLGGLYVLSTTEWSYLFGNSTDRAGKCKWLSIDGVNCLVIAPDNSSVDLSTISTLEAANSANLVCLPAAGIWNGASFYYAGTYGYYWSATPNALYTSEAYDLNFSSSSLFPVGGVGRVVGFTVRLVRGL